MLKSGEVLKGRNAEILFVIGLMWGLILFLAVHGYCQGVLVHRDTLLSKAEEEGDVRVIVTFQVPGLEKQQKISRRSGARQLGVNGSQSAMARAKEADEALAKAISSSASSVFSGLGLESKVDHVFKTVPQAVIRADHADLIALEESPQVLSVTEDEPIPLPDLTPAEDSRNRDGWGSYGVQIINAPAAWNKGYDGEGCYVAVLDTGVRTSHEMFQGKRIEEACFSTNSSYSSSLCPGGAAEATGPGSAVPPDRFGHGTHVSGIAVGNQPDGDLKGVAPGADLVAVQVFSYVPSWNDVGSYISDQIKGLEYVYGLRATYNIAAVNMSLGSGHYDDYCDSDSRKPVMDNLRAVGIVTTVSTGNDGYCGAVNAPACVSSAVAVGGSDYNDRIYAWNNWHPAMQAVFAPGVSIYSALASGDTAYGTKSGTSMAAPHVAGAFAIFRQAVPGATVDQIENAVKEAGISLDSGCDTDPASGPRLDVNATLAYLVPAIPTLGTWGMALLLTCLAAVGALAVRRRYGAQCNARNKGVG